MMDEIEYYNWVAPYKLFAMLYDKTHRGIIDERDFEYANLSSYYIRLLRADKGQHPEVITKCETIIKNIIEEEKLDIAFCDKLKNSAGLRYWIAFGFYDVPIIKCEKNGNDFIMTLDCKNAWFRPAEKAVKDMRCVNLIFKGASDIENSFKEGEVSQKRPKFYYKTGEIRCLEDGKFLFGFQFSDFKRSVNSVSQTRTIEITAKDIVIE